MPVVRTNIHIGSGGNHAWTPRFQEFFDGAGLNINNAMENLVPVVGHRGPHPQAYHQYVFDRLNTATNGLSTGTPAYNTAVTNTLNSIKTQATTPGHQVNSWLTGQ